MSASVARIVRVVVPLALLPSLLGWREPAMAPASPLPECHGQTVTVPGTAGPDHLTGTPLRDVIWGGGGDDEINALSGDDVVCGGPGRDRIVAGSGADWVQGAAGADIVSGGPGKDDIRGGGDTDFLAPGAGDDRAIGNGGLDSLEYVASPRGVHINLATGVAHGWGTDRIEGFEQVEASRFDDLVIGTRSRDFLFGGRGDDVLRAGSGNDFVQGNHGDDLLDAGRGRDFAVFDQSRRSIRASLRTGAAYGDGADRLRRIENLVGSDLDDLLRGDDGKNVLFGGEGSDRLFGRGNDDRLLIFAGGTQVDGEGGRDSVEFLLGPVAASLLAGSAHVPGGEVGIAEVEDLVGSTGDDTLVGNNLPNHIAGEEGDDKLYGRGDRDRLDGGPGQDVCRGERTRRCEKASVSRRKMEASRSEFAIKDISSRSRRRLPLTKGRAKGFLGIGVWGRVDVART